MGNNPRFFAFRGVPSGAFQSEDLRLRYGTESGLIHAQRPENRLPPAFAEKKLALGELEPLASALLAMFLALVL